jgi:hypothetical protein
VPVPTRPCFEAALILSEDNLDFGSPPWAFAAGLLAVLQEPDGLSEGKKLKQLNILMLIPVLQRMQ